MSDECVTASTVECQFMWSVHCVSVPPEKAKLITKEFMSLISPLVIYIVT